MRVTFEFEDNQFRVIRAAALEMVAELKEIRQVLQANGTDPAQVEALAERLKTSEAALHAAIASATAATVATSNASRDRIPTSPTT